MDRILKSKYKILDKIHENDCSITYKGSHAETGINLLIKIFKRNYLSSSLTKKLKKDVLTLSKLDHPSIPKLLDGDYGWQGFYFIREYVEGSKLDCSKTPLDIEKACGIAIKVCESLAAAHSRGIVHGNLTPNNILLEGGSVKVTDFGISAAVNSSLENRVALIMNGSSVYLSPEEILGQDPDMASDIYKLGLFLHLATTGTLPFSEEKSPLLSSLKRIRRSPHAPSSINSKIPRYMDDIILKCLETDPLLRFDSADSVMHSLKNNILMPPKTFSIDMPEINYSMNVEKEQPQEKKGKAEKKEFDDAERAAPKINLFRWVIVAFLTAVAAGIVYSLFQIFLIGE